MVRRSICNIKGNGIFAKQKERIIRQWYDGDNDNAVVFLAYFHLKDTNQPFFWNNQPLFCYTSAHSFRLVLHKTLRFPMHDSMSLGSPTSDPKP